MDIKKQDISNLKKKDVIDHTDIKVWLISQIEKSLEAYHNTLQSNKRKFENRTDNYLAKLTIRRNSILSLMGLVISVIIGLSAIELDFAEGFIKPFLITILVIDILVGTLTYIIANILMHRASKKLWEIEEAYVEGYAIQNFTKGFLYRRTLKLDSITADQLYVLYLYFLVVQGGITSKIVSEYEKAYPKESYPHYYEGVESDLNRIIMDNGYEIYSGHKEEFTKVEFLNILKISKASEELLLPQFQSMIRFLIARYQHL